MPRADASTTVSLTLKSTDLSLFNLANHTGYNEIALELTGLHLAPAPRRVRIPRTFPDGSGIRPPLDQKAPASLPDMSVVAEIREPMVKCCLMVPNGNIGDMMQLVLDKRGNVEHTESLDARRVMITASLPLNEILVDFHDKIKTLTRGYGSMDYEPSGYREADLVKLEMLVNGEPVDAFSSIVHRDKADSRGRSLAAKLKEVIPPQLYQVAIQAAIGGKIIARENVNALRKNVTAKCYGGDITRKRKLLEKQKEGKKRMKAIGSVNIPQEAFIQVLKTN